VTWTSLRIHAPESERAAVDLLDGLGPAARPYAGGTGLFLSDERRHLEQLVDLKEIAALAEVERRGDELHIGAAVSLWALERSRELRDVLPEVAALLGAIANPRVLASGTLVGNICLAAPRTDLTALLAALDARVICLGPGGERDLDAVDLPSGPGRTTLRPAEIVTRLSSQSRRSSSDWPGSASTRSVGPTASVTVLLEGADGHVTRTAVAVGAAVPRALRLTDIETALTGAPLEELPGRVTEIVAAVPPELDVTSDGHGSAEYKAAPAGGAVRARASRGGRKARPCP